jgi:capsular polysaccharide biosynthesis protein
MSAAEQQDQQKLPFGVEEEVDLLEYLHAVLRYKYRILVAAMMGAIMVFGLSMMFENIYMSTAVVAVNIEENPGGVSPKDYRASDALGLIEHDFIIEGAHSNERDRLMARMRSMKFSQIFIEENNLLPYIFHKQWDKENNTWLDGFQPDSREAGLIFSRKIRGLETDEQTGLLRINFRSRDPAFSAQLANSFVQRFNQYMRDNQISILKARRDYLEQRLKEVENIELHKSIFRLLETQMAAESLLYARSEYPLEVIQPAFPPLNKSSPNRKKWTALSFVGLVMLGIMITIGMVLLKKIREGLAQYEAYEKNRIRPGNTKNGHTGQTAEKNQAKNPSRDQHYKGDDWVD